MKDDELLKRLESVFIDWNNCVINKTTALAKVKEIINIYRPEKLNIQQQLL